MVPTILGKSFQSPFSMLPHLLMIFDVLPQGCLPLPQPPFHVENLISQNQDPLAPSPRLGKPIRAGGSEVITIRVKMAQNV